MDRTDPCALPSKLLYKITKSINKIEYHKIRLLLCDTLNLRLIYRSNLQSGLCNRRSLYFYTLVFSSQFAAMWPRCIQAPGWLLMGGSTCGHPESYSNTPQGKLQVLCSPYLLLKLFKASKSAAPRVKVFLLEIILCSFTDLGKTTVFL